MSAFEDAVIQRIRSLEREVERLQRWERPTGGGGVTDHGGLTGLADDDHPQYLLRTDKAADSDKLDGKNSTDFASANHIHDHGGLTGLADDDHPQYLLRTDKAADSDKLDGVDITAFKGLDSLTEPKADRVLFWDGSAGALKWLTLGTGLTITDTTIKPSQPQFYPITTPLTSTSWDGDAYSTNLTATKIDLSDVFDVPAGVKAIAVRLTARDSATFGTDGLFLNIGPDSTYNYAVCCVTFGGDVRNTVNGICPCNDDGDIYYRINASGTGTLDAWIEIWGYWL